MAETWVRGIDCDFSDGIPRQVWINKIVVDAEPALKISNAGTGPDIYGDSGAWNIAKNGDATLNDVTVNTISSPDIAPVGSIVPFYDYNGALTFDSTYWAYCNGQSKTVGGIGAQNLPDLSNRYLVGFGTEGGADIGSAAWATAAVGNASNQVDLQHGHSVPSHYHGKGSLNISSSGSHGHSEYATDVSGGNLWYLVSTIGGTAGAGAQWIGTTSTDAHVHNNADFAGSAGDTGGVDGDSAMSSGNSGSTTQSIQPRSIRVRYIMRIK